MAEKLGKGMMEGASPKIGFFFSGNTVFASFPGGGIYENDG
jgi:hypothetical protein